MIRGKSLSQPEDLVSDVAAGVRHEEDTSMRKFFSPPAGSLCRTMFPQLNKIESRSTTSGMKSILWPREIVKRVILQDKTSFDGMCV